MSIANNKTITATRAVWPFSRRICVARLAFQSFSLRFVIA
jgi:hypothetical protein